MDVECTDCGGHATRMVDRFGKATPLCTSCEYAWRSECSETRETNERGE